MASVHPVSKKMHGYEQDEDQYREPVFSKPVHVLPPQAKASYTALFNAYADHF
jgi:hypothetical protein